MYTRMRSKRKAALKSSMYDFEHKEKLKQLKFNGDFYGKLFMFLKNIDLPNMLNS